MLYANAIYQTSVEVAERSVKETTNTARIKYLCTAPGLYFLSKYWIPNLVLHCFSFLRERTPGHPWMQIFIISFNWQGCRKIFEIPLPTQLWGTIFIYTTSSYHYSPLASWCSVMQWKNPLFCVTFHIVSGPLQPALSWSVSPNSKSFTGGYTDHLIPGFTCMWRPVSKDCPITVRGFLLLFLSQMTPDL